MKFTPFTSRKQAIQKAILAERLACAKIAQMQALGCRVISEELNPSSPELRHDLQEQAARAVQIHYAILARSED